MEMSIVSPEFPPSLHRYLYAYSSPMTYVDPWGEFSWFEFKYTMLYFAEGTTKTTAEMGANMVTLGGYGGLKEGLQNGTAYNSPLGGVYAYGRGVRNFLTLGYYNAVADAKEGHKLSAVVQHSKDVSGWTDYEHFGTHLGEGKYLEATGDLLIGAGKTAGLGLGATVVAKGGMAAMETV